MDKTLLPIRIAFVLICAAAGWLVSATLLAGDERRGLPVMVGFAIGALVVLVDIMLKGFSLRGLSAMTFGLAIGLLVAHMFAISPLLEISSDGTSAAGGLDPKTVYLIRVALFVICPYLATVIAMRCKDEFNLVIPYVRFVPHEVDVPLVVMTYTNPVGHMGYRRFAAALHEVVEHRHHRHERRSLIESRQHARRHRLPLRQQPPRGRSQPRSGGLVSAERLRRSRR